MASGGIPPNEELEEKWEPPGKGVGKPQLNEREEEGKKGHAENRKEKTTQRINVDSHDHLMLLKKLKFKDFFLQKHPSFDGEFRYGKDDSEFYLETICTDELKIEIEKTMNEFISSLKRIILDSNVKALLFVKDSKCALDFKQKLKDRKVNCFLIKPKGFIYTTPEYGEKVKEVVDELFLCMTVRPEEPRYFHFTTENFQKFRIDHENKDFIFERNVGVISFAAVKSAVADELSEAMGLYESDKCKFVHTPMQTEAIQKWGPQKKDEYWQFLNQLHSEGRYISSGKAFLLNQKPTEEYIKQKLTKSKIRALFEVESDYRVNLIAINSIEADKAVKVLEDSIHEIRICYTDALVEDISSNDFKEHFDKWKGKYLFDGFDTALQDPEKILLATDDIADEFNDLLEGKFCKQKSTGLEETYRTDATRAIINPDLFREVEAQVNLRKIEEKYHCKISKEFLEPQLANCWLMGNDHSHILRVHLITGHAESLNVDAVVCPCTSFMFPVNDCFGLYRNIKIEASTAKLPLNYTKEILAPDGFLCEEIVFLVTCEPNNAEVVDLVSTVRTALRRADEMSCKSLAIPLTLLPEAIMERKKQAKEIAKALKKLPYLKKLDELFVCESSYHPTDQIINKWKRIFVEIERCIDFGPLQESAVRMTIPSKESYHASIINVKVVTGSLVSQQVDAIVNTCGRDLNLNNGAVSLTILQKGGQSIQEELKKKYKTIRFGEVAVTESGALQCKHILHSALYNWTSVGNFSLKILKLVIWNCLTKADELKCSSIAFPSLGTGKLWHPFHLMAETMFHTIQCYEQSHSDTNIRDIFVVLYEKDQECIHQFKAVEKMKQKLFQSREESHPHPFWTGKRMLASQPVTVDLLPSRSTWRWGCLLRVAVGPGGNEKDLEWDEKDSCWTLRISPPSMFSSISSIFSNFQPHDIVKKRITSIELSLSQSRDGYKKQIEDFFYLMNRITENHFINHILIVFPSVDEFMKESKNIDGHWKPGRKTNDFPITYTLTGSPQDVSQAKAKIDDMITKMERDFQRRNFKDAAHGSSVDPEMNDFPIFETVTGVVMCADTKEVSEIEEMKKTVQGTGCKAEMNKNNLSIHIEGNLSQIVKANQRLIERWEKDISKMDTMGETVFIVNIPMSLRDYQAVKFFGNKMDWFKRISNQVMYTKGSLCITDLDADSAKNIENDTKQLLSSVQMMSSENVLINVKDIDLKKAMHDVEQEKPNVCLINTDNDIEIITESYTDLQEAKGLLLQMSVGKTKGSLQLSAGKANKRAGRTFENTEEESSKKNSQDTNSNEMPLSMKQSMRSRKVELKTKEGLIIQIYAGSITRLDVDCIVNAANESLMHGGGVAAAISEAAGYQFDQESRDYVQKNGSIQVGTCCVTSAGKLPYKYVIHTVGPRWGDYRDKNRCLQDLQDSVEATFIAADERKMSSIAIPAISSGIFAVPRDKCVEEYYRAAMSFSKNYSFKSLREIHFVDRDETMVRAIQELFLQREPSATIIGKSETLEKKNDTNAFVVEKTVHSTMPLSISYTTVNVSDSLQIKVHIGNITDIAADAVVCPQDKDCLSENDIARDIFGKTADKQPSFKLMKYGDVCSQKLQENSKWKMIIHAVTPVYDLKYAKNYSEFVQTLNTIIQKIIKTADEAKFHSIAIPLLGTGTEEYKTPVEACASSFFKAVMANKSELMYLNDIYLVLKEKEQEKMYLEDFACSSCKITQRLVTNNGKSDDFGKTMKEMPKEDENCCICMDTPTKPKQLRKCGHIFCKECIEQYFEYKPACPSCGTIYGKVMGDQPPGTMSIRTNSIRLQGVNDSSGTIVLTYFFNDGKQGAEHPDPGKVYKGFSRSGYVPNNEKGRLVAKLLNVAFSRRLVFTIGRSRTTGHDGVITWNDIHHKTRMEGGPARFGYPDPTYLDRVLEELEAKGVTEESADDPEEYKEYSREIRF